MSANSECEAKEQMGKWEIRSSGNRDIRGNKKNIRAKLLAKPNRCNRITTP